jgi:hypothetical protein
MTLEEAWRAHAHAKKRFRKEVAKGNTEIAREHWQKAESLWRSIGGAIGGVVTK